MAVTVLKNIKENKKGKPSQHLKNAIHYILNLQKTENGLWIGSNCGTTAENIYEAMMQTKNDYQKLWGRQGYHFVISFPPGECDEKTAYTVGKEFCEEYLGDNFDYCFAIHNDQRHMHCHIVFNSVSRYGDKYRYVNGDWEKHIQPITDALCRKHNLKELTYDKSERHVKKSYAEHAAGKADKFVWKRIIRLDIDRAVSVSDTLQEFYSEMQRMGYTLRIGQSQKHGTYIAYKHSAMIEVEGHTAERARRDYLLGKGYTYADIQKRLIQEDKNVVPADTVYVEEKLHAFREHKKTPRFQACMVMRYRQAAQLHYYDLILKDQARVRRDLLKIDQLRDECNFLIDNNVKSVTDAEALLEKIKQDIRKLKEEIKDQEFMSVVFNEEEKAIRQEYFMLRQKIEQDKNLTDKAFETIADKIEEFEKQYPGLLAAEEKRPNKNLQKALEKANRDKRILMSIIREAQNTLSVKAAPVIKEELQVQVTPDVADFLEMKEMDKGGLNNE